MTMRPFRDADWSEWLRLSLGLFADHAAEELVGGMRDFRTRADANVFVAERPDGSLAGFVEVGARLYADGCASA